METAAQNYFDEAERDRIRRALLRYMEDNRIGVPTLQRAIAESHKIVLDRIPQKSLQRFLGNTHRTNDMLVRFCREFIESQLIDDPLDSYGAQLAAFHAVPAPDDGQDTAAPLSLAQCAGAYEGIGAVRPKGLAVLTRDEGKDKTRVSTLSLAVRGGASFLRATESVHNWRYEEGRQAEARRPYEGVAVVTAAGVMVALRSVLTGAPRTWWLMPDPEGLAGPGAEPAGALNAPPSTGLERAGYQYLTFCRVESAGHG